MVRTVWIVQHARKETGPGDPSLTPEGRAQAVLVAEALRGCGAGRLLTSPLLRTRQTAQPLASALDLEPEVDDRLLERMNWDGSVSIETFLRDWDACTADRTFVPCIGRSSVDAGGTFASLVRELLDGAVDVVAVSHGGVTVDGLRTLVGDERLSQLLPTWQDGVPPAGITTITGSVDDVQVVAVGDTAHLH